MGLWKVWLLGVVITVVTAILVRMNKKETRNLRYILIPICVIIVGGIPAGWWDALLLSGFDGNVVVGVIGIMDIISIMFLIWAIMFIIWTVGKMILGLWNEKKIEIKIYFLIFIISTIAWTAKYYDYYQNFETTQETTITHEEQRQLLYFCNIPVQNISGKISGSRYRVSGSISTSDELSYWYVNENGEGIIDSAPANSSKINFISDNEIPYLNIIAYRYQEKYVNPKYEKEVTMESKEWKEYVFYLPEEIMQYQIE